MLTIQRAGRWVLRQAVAGTLIALAAVASPPVQAHAIIESVQPAVNSTVSGPDVAIMARFNSRLDRVRSRLTLKGADGVSFRLEILPPASSAAIEQATLTAKASGLAPGKYVLNWQVLAVDGHLTRGGVPFTVSGR